MAAKQMDERLKTKKEQRQREMKKWMKGREGVVREIKERACDFQKFFPILGNISPSW